MNKLVEMWNKLPLVGKIVTGVVVGAPAIVVAGVAIAAKNKTEDGIVDAEFTEVEDSEEV